MNPSGSFFTESLPLLIMIGECFYFITLYPFFRMVRIMPCILLLLISALLTSSMTTFNLERAAKNCRPEVLEFLPPRQNQAFPFNDLLTISPSYFRYKDICSTLLENMILMENGITRYLSPGKTK